MYLLKTIIFSTIILSSISSFSQLLPNGSFEEINDNERLANYVYKDTLYQHIDTTYSYSGKQSAKFNYDKEGIKTLYFFGNRAFDGKTLNYIPVKEGQKYELSFYFKVSKNFKPGVNRGIYGQFAFKDKSSANVGFDESAPQISSIENIGTWEKVTLSTVITHNVSQIAAGIFYRGNGSVWVDNFSVKLIKQNAFTSLNASFESDSIFNILKNNRFQKNKTIQSYSLTETNTNHTYLGSGALTYKSSSQKDTAYYYNNSERDSPKKLIEILPGDDYTISGYARVSSKFKGKGSKITILFYDSKETLISTQSSKYINTKIWSKVEIDTIIVPQNAFYMSYRIEFRGKGRFWFDHISLKRKNLIVNSGFEVNKIAPNNKPDFWRPRMGDSFAISNLEKESDLVFKNGITSALFSNTSDTQKKSYYYGPYSADGSKPNRISVSSSETYRLSAQVKTQNITGKGARIALLFYNEDGNVLKTSSKWFKDTIWTEKTLLAKVPENYNYMEYSIEYSGSSGKAWFDNLYLKKNDSEWYNSEVSIDTFETLQYEGTQKNSLQHLKSKFETFHRSMEKDYADNHDIIPLGTWKNPYGCPWVRLSANAAIGYLNANEVIPNKIYKKRAKAALEFLLEDQEDNGSFGLHRLSKCSEATFDPGSIMYEGSIASVALLTGYRLNKKDEKATEYLQSAERLCDYLVQNIPPSVNANFNGFAIWALAEYNSVAPHPKEAYVNKALEYFERVHAFQLDNGMWDDAHNQLIHYHGIITRGLVNLYRIMPDNHPKKEVVRHSIYKAINHIIKRQRPNGKYFRFPGKEKLSEDNFPMESILIAYKHLGYSELEKVLNDLTTGAENMSLNKSQGHRFASLGILLNSYYNDNN